MDNKIITLDDIKNRSIDEIFALYRNGYKLDESYNTPATLQVCPPGCSPESESSLYGTLGFFTGVVIGLVVAFIVMPKKSD